MASALQPTTTLQLLAEAAAAATPSPTLAMLHALSSTPGEIPKLVCVQRGGRANSARWRDNNVSGWGALKLVNNDFVAPPGLCDSAGQRLQPSSNWRMWMEADDIHVLLDDETLLVMQITRRDGAERLRWRLPTRSCQRALFEDGCFFLRVYVEGKSARKSSIEVQLRHNNVVIADGTFTVFMGTKQASIMQPMPVLPLRSGTPAEMSTSTFHRRQKQHFPGRGIRSPDAALASLTAPLPILRSALLTAPLTAPLTEPTFKRATFTRTAARDETWGILPTLDEVPSQPIVLPGVADYTLLDLSIDAAIGRPEPLSEEERQLVAELSLRIHPYMDERASAVVYMASRLFRSSDTAQLLAALWSALQEMSSKDEGKRPAQTGERRSVKERTSADIAVGLSEEVPSVNTVTLPRTAARLSRLPAQTTGQEAPGTTFQTPSASSPRGDASPPPAPDFSENAKSVHVSGPEVRGEEDDTRTVVSQTLKDISALTEAPLDETNHEAVKDRYYKLAAQVILLVDRVPKMMQKYQDSIDFYWRKSEKAKATADLATEKVVKPHIPGSIMQDDAYAKFFGLTSVEMVHFAVFLNSLSQCATELVKENELNHDIHTAYTRNYLQNMRQKKNAPDYKLTKDDKEKERKEFGIYTQSDEYKLERSKLLLERFKAIGYETLAEKANQVRKSIAVSSLVDVEGSSMASVLLMMDCFLNVVARVKPNKA